MVAVIFPVLLQGALDEPMFKVAPEARFNEPVLAKLLNPLIPRTEPLPIKIVPGLVMVAPLIEIESPLPALTTPWLLKLLVPVNDATTPLPRVMLV